MTPRLIAVLLAAAIALLVTPSSHAQDSAPTATTAPTQLGATGSDEAASALDDAETSPAPALAADTVGPEHPDLANGSFGVVTGDEKVTPQTSARIGFVGDTLHVMAAEYEGAIFNPEVDLHLVLEPGTIQRIGLKRYGFNRQIHADLGDRTVVFSLSGGAFVDAKGTTALYERLVASGVPSFKPKRFVGYPPKTPITIYY